MHGDCLDFADVKTVMQSAGSALMGIGRASGDDRAVEAAASYRIAITRSFHRRGERCYLLL